MRLDLPLWSSRSQRTQLRLFAVFGLSSSWRRPYSDSSTSRERPARPEPQTFKIACGSAGSITVDLYNSHLLANSTSPLYIYLPPTGLHLRETHPAIPSFLLSPTNALARINYRWNQPPPSPRPTSSSSTSSTILPSPSPPLLTSHQSYANHPFPTPLHDTLHAYNFLTTSLLPSFAPQLESTSSPYKSTFSPDSAYYKPPPTPKTAQRPLIIYGSYLGGTLATSLALTESLSSKHHAYSIAGLIVKNGIFDWTGIGTSLPPESSSEESEKKPPSSPEQSLAMRADFHWDTKTLHALKMRLFASPAGTFDAFASPVLFFRTSGLDVPATWPCLEPPTTTSTAHEDTTIMSTSLSSPPPPRSSTSTPITTHLASTTQKAHLKFPPRDSGLKIPRTLLLTTSPPAPPTPYLRPQSPSLKRKPTPKSRSKAKAKSDSITPETQAYELESLMRRSLTLHEFKDRREWDEAFDAETDASERVEVYELKRGTEVRGEGEVFAGVEGKGNGETDDEEAVVSTWIKDYLG
ncbi:uncharacterized protein BP5553_04485 [Venustampulla echinocandica]|uniref:Alpha/beta-hydrolase n=1 Tax=Venustampulla echinocandica TaxID=2656787 RepID=A0A370TNF6_9HELO|nr:uncharacterized protein BP5553_04485 [Venustampulla echinocandica]RDL37052.1 hypothetical protein BP5553_04485 [Venustampulla echinocandica]